MEKMIKVMVGKNYQGKNLKKAAMEMYGYRETEIPARLSNHTTYKVELLRKEGYLKADETVLYVI